MMENITTKSDRKDDYVSLKKEKINDSFRIEDSTEELKRDGLKPVHITAYSVGHFGNDLCASMWFVYLTWYIKNVVGMNELVTAGSILSG